MICSVRRSGNYEQHSVPFGDGLRATWPERALKFEMLLKIAHGASRFEPCHGTLNILKEA